MDQQRLQILAQKYLEGTATPAEAAELHQWYDQADTAQPLPEDGDAVRARMKLAIERRTRPALKVRLRWMAAAAVTIGLFAGVYLLFRPATQPDSVATKGYPYKEDAAPGKDKALLTLADGSVIELDSARNGTIGRQGQTVINKDAAAISYEKAGSEQQTVQHNTLSTPRGGQFRIVLPDGTQVWINAASSLRFPTAFTGSERLVELKGEAYFEVEKDIQHPFIVQLENGQRVEVLGTHFNVKAYADEKLMQTSLLEGVIRLQGITLKPGQQARQVTAARIKEGVPPAPVQVLHLPFIEDETAWKQGMFIFNDDPLDEVMRQLSRWYNIEIAYTSDIIKTREFTGQISRNEPLSEVLRMLELTGAVHFRIENGKVLAAD